jgi:Flp pilus assembly pilin Flp
MKELIKKFMKEEDGATIVEYILMLAVAGGIVLIFSPNIREALVGWLNSMFSNMNEALDHETASGITI